jgi:hypothetical protein
MPKLLSQQERHEAAISRASTLVKETRERIIRNLVTLGSDNLPLHDLYMRTGDPTAFSVLMGEIQERKQF